MALFPLAEPDRARLSERFGPAADRAGLTRGNAHLADYQGWGMPSGTGRFVPPYSDARSSELSNSPLLPSQELFEQSLSFTTAQRGTIRRSTRVEERLELCARLC